MLSPLNAPPTYITPEEHTSLTSSTPTSFVDIPPVLRWSDEAVEVSLAPHDGFWAGKVKGQLWVTEDAVAFLPTSGESRGGFTLPYTSLTLHALTPASEGSPAHIYCQVDESDAVRLPAGSGAENGQVEEGLVGGMNGHGHGSGGDGYGEPEDEEFAEMREVRLYVEAEKLQPLFSALSSCSALHASLLPSGEPSSFGFFPSNDDIDDGDGAWSDADEQDDGAGEEDEGEGGEEGGAGRNIDPVSRFESLIDWGSVPKPLGWDEDAEEVAARVEDAPEP